MQEKASGNKLTPETLEFAKHTRGSFCQRRQSAPATVMPRLTFVVGEACTAGAAMLLAEHHTRRGPGHERGFLVEMGARSDSTA